MVLEILDFSDNRLDFLNRLDLIKRIQEYVESYQPECVYVHHAGDVNVDHPRLHDEVVTTSRPIPGHVVKRPLSFELEVVRNGSRRGLGRLSMPTGLWIFQISGLANGKPLRPTQVKCATGLMPDLLMQ